MAAKNLSQMLNDHVDWLNQVGGEQFTLSDKDLSWLTLSELNMSRSIMIGVNFESSDLSSTNFYKADLAESSFKKGILSKANFREANLTACDFRSASLKGVNFRDSILDGSIFYGADLSEADFQGASLMGVSFQGAKLFGASIAEGWVLTGRYYQINKPGYDDGFVEIYETLRGWYIRTAEFEGDVRQFSMFIRRKYGQSDLEKRYQNLVDAICKDE